jgi:uncharacterized linocin/CFP29 family protein
VNHLFRDQAPVTDAAWAEVDAEADRSLRLVLGARRLLDVVDGDGWTQSAVTTGRVTALAAGPVDDVDAATRRVQAIVELRTPFTVDRAELDAVDRGATDPDLSTVVAAARAAATAEDRVVFNGYELGGVAGIGPSSPHDAISIPDAVDRFPTTVTSAVAVLRDAGVGGPYGIALGTRGYTSVIESTERGGYPVLEHLGLVLGGSVVWAPAVDGAIVLSQRGGDFELTIAQDFAVGYRAHDSASIDLYLQETLAFRVLSAEAAVPLTHG